MSTVSIRVTHPTGVEEQLGQGKLTTPSPEHPTIAVADTTPAAPPMTKENAEEASNLKRLHWDPINQASTAGGAATYWSTLKREEVIGDDLERMFGLDQKKATPTQTTTTTNTNTNNTAANTTTATTIAATPPANKPTNGVRLEPAQLATLKHNLHHVNTDGTATATTATTLAPVALNPSVDEPSTSAGGAYTPSSSQSRARADSLQRSASPTSLAGRHSHHSITQQSITPPDGHLAITASLASPTSTATEMSTTTAAHDSTHHAHHHQHHSSRSKKASGDNLQLPADGDSPRQSPASGTGAPALLSLGEILALSPRDRPALPPRPTASTPQPRRRSLQQNVLDTEHSMDMSPGGPGRARAGTLPFRPSTPQARGRMLGHQFRTLQQGAGGGGGDLSEALMPNFAFLKAGTPMKAAILPPPSPRNTSGSSAAAATAAADDQPLSRSGSGNSLSDSAGESSSNNNNRSTPNRTPRNLEIGSIHLYSEPAEKGPRSWNFTSPSMMAAAANSSSSAAAGGASALEEFPGSGGRNDPTVGMTRDPSSASGGGAGAVGHGVLSPTSEYSPTVLGSGILNDILSTNNRVVEALRAGQGAVLVDETRIVDTVTAHGHILHEAALHIDGEFHTQLLRKKYNSDLPGLNTDHIPTSPEFQVVQRMLGEKLSAACPFAPHQWYFNPANLPLVLTYHLVLQTIDFGLTQAPPIDVPQFQGVDPVTHQPKIVHHSHAYTSLDLATSLAEVIKINPHAFDADHLTRVDELRLGAWLQPAIFAKALEDNPHLVEQWETSHGLGASSSSGASAPTTISSIPRHQRTVSVLIQTIPWTFPGLRERARLLRELGFVLLRFYNGSAVKLVEEADHSCSRLVEILTQHLPGMRDAAIYKGSFVFFYTRAQTFVRNLWVAFHGAQWGHFHDLGDLTGRTDGVLLCLFHQMGFIRYSNEWRGWVDAGQDIALLPSDVEVEVRVAVGFVLRRLCELLRNLNKKTMEVQLDAWLRSHYRPESHEFATFLPSPYDETRGEVVALAPNHRSSSVWY